MGIADQIVGIFQSPSVADWLFIELYTVVPDKDQSDNDQPTVHCYGKILSRHVESLDINT